MRESFPQRGSRPALPCVLVLLCVWMPTAAAPPPADILRAETFFVRGDDAAAVDAYSSALDQLVPLVLAAQSTDLPETALAVERLADLFAVVGMSSDAREKLAQWIRHTENTPSSPAAASLAWRLRMLAALYEPEAPENGIPSVLAPLGLLRHWRVVGPFDNDRGSAFLTRLDAEDAPALAPGDLAGVEYAGKKRAIAWRSLPGAAALGVVNLAALYRDNEQVLAYALTYVQSPNAQDVALRLGTADGYRVWVNGALVGSRDIERPFRFDQDIYGIRLEEGWNSILIKVAQSKGAWQFAARLTALDGHPLDTFEEGQPEQPPIRVEEAPQISCGPTALEMVGDQVAAAPDDSRAHYLQGALLRASHAHDSSEHPDTEALERSLRIDDRPAIAYLELARSQERESSIAAERDDNAWRESLLEAARRGSARAAVRLGEYYLETFGNVSEALRWSAAALQVHPTSAPALRLARDAEEVAGLPASRLRFHAAMDKLQELDQVAARDHAGHLAESGNWEEARTLLSTALAARPRARGTRRELVELLLTRGRSSDASALVGNGARLHPWDTEWWLTQARIHTGQDRLNAAVAAVEEALKIRPDDEGLHEQLGSLRLRGGQRDLALGAFEEALRLQPNLPSLRQYVEFLNATPSDFEERFRQDVSTIAKEAWENAAGSADDDPSRILLDMKAVRVGTDGRTKSFVQHVAQILNDRGLRDYDRFAAFYVSGEQVLEFKAARVLHRDGSISEAKLSRHGYDAVTVAGIAEFGTHKRARIDVPPLAVGDVVEIRYVQEDVRQGFFGDYYGHREIFQQMVQIERKRFVLEVPAGREFYFHARKLDLEPQKETIDDEWVRYTWDAMNLAKLEPEPGMAPLREVAPLLEISTFKDWEAFSTWYWNLIRRQYETSPELKKKVVELTSGLTGEVEKVRAIYNFVVTDIRYNAWEFGVHGFKPYNAATIFARRFGDCKDKATLLSVMLREVDVPAYPVLIRGERRRGEEDLTLPLINHFNHCISYVPASGGRGEMFLDGTAQRHPLEQLPSMDRGARVLIVGEEGEALVHETPWNQASDFALVENVVVRVRPDLGASLDVRVRCGGDYAVYIRKRFEIQAQREPALEQLFASRFAGATIKDQAFSNLDDIDEPVHFKLTVDAPSFIAEAPEGLVIETPRDFFESSQSLLNLSAMETRKYDVLLGNPRRSALEVRYELPDGFEIKTVPPARKIETAFGSLEIRFQVESPRILIAHRELELSAPRVGISDYEAFRTLTAALEQLRGEKIILDRNS